MAGLNDWMGPTQVLGPRERQALIEAGVMKREDFMDKPVPSATPVQPPVGGSSAQEDLARSLGLTVPQLIAKQDAQKREMMKKQNEMARKLKGYAGGGAVKPAYTGTTPREANPWIRNLKALNPFEAYDPTVEQEPLFEQEANTYDERMTRAQGRLNEFAADMVLDPLNLVGGAVLGKLLKGVGSVGKRVLAPTSMAVGSAAYGSDAEASKLGVLAQLLKAQLAGLGTNVEHAAIHTPIWSRTVKGTKDGVNLDKGLPRGIFSTLRDLQLTPQEMRKSGMMHTHVPFNEKGYSDHWLAAPPSEEDYMFSMNIFDNKGKNYVLHQPSGVTEQFGINEAARPEMLKLARTPRMTRPYLDGEAGIAASKLIRPGEINPLFSGTLPPQFENAEEATRRLNQLLLKDRGIATLENDGPQADNDIMRELLNTYKKQPRRFAKGGMIGALGRIAKRLGSEAAPTRRGVADIIKERGGQWINGSVEDALKSTLKTSVSGMSPEDRLAELQKYAPNVTRPESIEALNVDMARQQRNIALNNWTKGPLTKHIKRDMGTANDPFVKLADQGIQVNDAPYTPNAGGPLKIKRSRQGYNPYGAAKTEAGKAWENTNDTLITQQSAADFRKLPYMLEENPWLATVADDTPVHSIGEDALYEGGIAHMLDELGNAIDPESGLPEHLRVTPDQLRSGNFSVDAAIRRVNDINKWRADVTTAANQAKANNAATHLHKDYGDGFKWVQLKRPEAKPLEVPIEKAEEHYASLPLGERDKWIEQWRKDRDAHLNNTDGTSALKDALKYEGDTMGHCVGGYCDDVADGRSQIYSLRDAKGQPHVTVEVVPPGKLVPITDEMRAERGYLRPHDKFMDLDTGYGHANDQVYPRIEQVKGKGNKAPIADYLPYVQDFVKSGQWSDVGALQNTGLRNVNGKYVNDVEYDQLLDHDGPNFAKGGLIDYNDLHGY